MNISFRKLPNGQRAGTATVFVLLALLISQHSVMAASFIAVGKDAGSPGEVRIYHDMQENGTFEILSDSFFPFGITFKGGVRVAMGDLDGDGNDELITGSGPGLVNTIHVWNLGGNGEVLAKRETLRPFGQDYKGGVFVAVGDVDGDGFNELVVSTSGGTPTVMVLQDFDGDGFLFDEGVTDEFNPFNAGAGVRIAMGDIDSDGDDEILTGTGPGTPGTVKIWNDTDGDSLVSDEPVFDEFLPFGNSFRGGVYVEAGRIDEGSFDAAEVIVSRGTGSPLVKIFSDNNANDLVSDDPMIQQFFGFSSGFTGGVRIAAADLDGDGFVEVIGVPGPGISTSLRIFNFESTAPVEMIDNFLAFPSSYKGGGFAAHGRILVEAFTSRTVPMSILDTASKTNKIVVPAHAGVVKDLEVFINIKHTFNADLDVVLQHIPSGLGMTLFTDIGSDSDGLYLYLNDEAVSDVGGTTPANGAALSGEFNLEGSNNLSWFDNVDASGEWRLVVTDDSAGDVGTLLSWGIVVRYYEELLF